MHSSIDTDPQKGVYENNKSVNENVAFVHAKLDKEKALGRIVAPFQKMLSSFSNTTSQCQLNLDRFFEICHMIILPTKHSKTVLPTSKLVLYGIEADSVTQTSDLRGPII